MAFAIPSGYLMSQTDSLASNSSNFSFLIKFGGVSTLTGDGLNNFDGAYPRGGSHSPQNPSISTRSNSMTKAISPYIGVGVLLKEDKWLNLYLGFSYYQIAQPFKYKKVSNGQGVSGPLPVQYQRDEDKGEGEVTADFLRCELGLRFRLFGKTRISLTLNPCLVFNRKIQAEIIRNSYMVTSSAHPSSYGQLVDSIIIYTGTKNNVGMDKPDLNSPPLMVPLSLGLEQEFRLAKQDFFIEINALYCIQVTYFSYQATLGWRLPRFRK